MTSLPDSARAVLESPALAHLVTLNPDGSPQVSVVWVGREGDEIVAGHLPEHRKVRNIRNDSRVALSGSPRQVWRLLCLRTASEFTRLHRLIIDFFVHFRRHIPAV
jgi:PPOX class probable F420-dependent enzyme